MTIKNIENLLEFIRVIDIQNNIKDLSINLLNYLLFLCSKISIFQIAERNIGKTTLINILRNLLKQIMGNEVKIFIVDQLRKLTLYEELANRPIKWRQKGIVQINNIRIILLNQDYSTLDDYSKDLLYNDFSKMITDKEYETTYWATKLILKNIDVVILLSVQPYSFTQVVLNRSEFEQLFTDRYVKYALIHRQLFDIYNIWAEKQKIQINLPNNLLNKLKEIYKIFWIEKIKIDDIRQYINKRINKKLLTDFTMLFYDNLINRFRQFSLKYLYALMIFLDYKAINNSLIKLAYNLLYTPLTLFNKNIYRSIDDRLMFNNIKFILQTRHIAKINLNEQDLLRITKYDKNILAYKLLNENLLNINFNDITFKFYDRLYNKIRRGDKKNGKRKTKNKSN